MNNSRTAGVHTVQLETCTEGQCADSLDQVVDESAVALVYNGISHAVMMTTPTDLEDFAMGFSLSEGIIQAAEQLLDIAIVEQDSGIEVQLRISSDAFVGLKARRRSLAGRSGCGLCGAESIEQAIVKPSPVTTALVCGRQAVIRGLASMAQQQPLKDITGSVHAAAFCSVQGEVLCLREDVGRHNALDKTLGAITRAGLSPQGFMLVTSRASYEMVCKTASANIPVLAAVSAPTSLAIELAQDSNLTLLGYVSAERQLIYTHSERFQGEV